MMRCSSKRLWILATILLPTRLFFGEARRVSLMYRIVEHHRQEGKALRNGWFEAIGIGCVFILAHNAFCQPGNALLPPGVNAIWDLSKAYRETTPTREHVCIKRPLALADRGGQRRTGPPPITGATSKFRVHGPRPRTVHKDSIPIEAGKPAFQGRSRLGIISA